MSSLDRARSAALRRMVDTVVITRYEPGPGTLNPATLLVTADVTTIYSGPGFYGDRLSGHERQEGFADKHEHRGMLRIPDGAADVRSGDLVDFTAGRLAGTQWMVEANLEQTAQGTQRFRLIRKEAEVHLS